MLLGNLISCLTGFYPKEEMEKEEEGEEVLSFYPNSK